MLSFVDITIHNSALYRKTESKKAQDNIFYSIGASSINEWSFLHWKIRKNSDESSPKKKNTTKSKL